MEQRRSKRKTKRLEIKFLTRDYGITGITSNFSKEGLFLRTQKGLPPGTILNLEIYLHSGETLKMSGKVVRMAKTPLLPGKNGMGIELKDVPQQYVNFYESM